MLSRFSVPFNKPYLTGNEVSYISDAQTNGQLSGDGLFTKKCQKWLEENVGCRKALLTPSCTAALEMVAILLDLGPGDEVIMPSYTFVSTANAFALRGATPVFVDIRPDTLNINELLIEEAITTRTRAIVIVHYAGVGCEMSAILDLADQYGLFVIEDAAHGLLAEYDGQQLGSFGTMAAFSFHETKNIISGEGGALVINDPQFIERAEIIREKGTNRNQFLKRKADKYTWVDVGSSYLMGELTAAFLWAQFEQAHDLVARRQEIYSFYDTALATPSNIYDFGTPHIPTNCLQNGHMYYLLLENQQSRKRFIQKMSEQAIEAVFHYVPLHSSPYGKRVGRVNGTLTVTNEIANRLVRLPLWIGLEQHQDRVLEAVLNIFSQTPSTAT